MKCIKCNASLMEVVSVTNTPYYYCNVCKHTEEKALKHLVFDSLLKELHVNLKTFSTNSINKIEILNSNNSLNLLINNKDIYNVNFPYKFSTMDIYFIENTVNYLVEDCLSIDSTLIDILVCA